MNKEFNVLVILTSMLSNLLFELHIHTYLCVCVYLSFVHFKLGITTCKCVQLCQCFRVQLFQLASLCMLACSLVHGCACFLCMCVADGLAHKDSV